MGIKSSARKIRGPFQSNLHKEMAKTQLSLGHISMSQFSKRLSKIDKINEMRQWEKRPLWSKFFILVLRGMYISKLGKMPNF